MMTVEQTAVSSERPFPGLRPFAYPDHEFFFGREDQTFALYRLVDRNRFVAAIGSSGSGKSSLVRAGLLPLLDAETAGAGGRTWLWREMRPGDDPLRRLTHVIASLAEDDDTDPMIASARQDRIAAHLRRSSFGVAEALGEIGGRNGKSIMLVIDQFEELFRYATGRIAGAGEQTRARDEAVQFVQLLLEATRTRTHKVHVLLTMRSDFIGDCARFYGLPEAVSTTQFLVPALTRDQLEEVMRKPVEKAGAVITADLVQRLLNDCSNELDQLPVLQHCLLRLWEEAGRTMQPAAGAVPAVDTTAGSNAHPPARVLTVSHYLTIGGFTNALSRHANDILKELPGAKLQLAVEQTFRALSELDKEGRAIRRALPFSQLLAETGVEEADLRRVLDRFRADDCSFLVPPQNERPVIEPTTRIDVGHEAFLRRWEKTSGHGADIGWLRAEHQDGERYRTLLAMAENEGDTLPPALVDERWAWWNERRRTPAWAERYGGGFDRVRRLLKASREQQAQRRRFQVASFAGAILIAAAMSFLWWRAETHKQRAEESQQRAAASHRIAVNTITESMDLVHVYLDDGTITVRGARELLAVVQQKYAQLINIGEDQPLEEALAAALAAGKQQDPETLKAGTRLLLTMSDVQVALSATDEALSFARSARTVIAPLLEKSPTDKDLLHLEYAGLFRMGDAKAALTDIDGAEQHYREALKIAQGLAEREPGDAERQRSVAFITNKIGDVHQERGDYAAAILEYEKSFGIARQQAAIHPDNPSWPRDVAAAKSRVGQVLEALGDHAGALMQYNEALRIQTGLVNAHPDSNILWSNQATTYRRIGGALKNQARYDEARTAYEEAVKIREKLHGKDPGNAAWHGALATDRAFVGDALIRKQDWSGAEQTYRIVLQDREVLAFRDPDNDGLKRNLAVAHDKMGDVLLAQQKLDDALSHYRMVVKLRQEMATADTKATSPLFAAQVKVGDVFLQQGKHDAATEAYHAAATTAEAAMARRDTGKIAWQVRLSSAHEKIGDAHAASVAGQEAAAASYRKALAVAKGVLATEQNHKSAQRQVESVESKLQSVTRPREPLESVHRD